MKITLTCTNKFREDYGKKYEYNSILEYALDERAAYDQNASETLDMEVTLSDSQIARVVDIACDLDMEVVCFGEFGIGNKWKEQSLIDFDNPYVDDEDVAQSFCNAINEAWLRVSCQY